MGIDDLRAASVILGDKSYVFGEESTVIDAISFGYVTQFLYLTEDGNVFKKDLTTQRGDTRTRGARGRAN